MTTHRGGLRVRPAPPDGEGPIVVLVHGTADRAASFERTRRSLASMTDLPVVSYDRRGYAGSSGLAASGDLDRHVADLLRLLDGRVATLFGHSFGGLIALGAAIEAPQQIHAVAVYEPPLPTEAWWPPVPELGPASEAAERFLRRMIGDEAWDALGDGVKERRRAEGPALLGDFAAAQTALRWDDLLVPVAAGSGTASTEHFIRSAEVIAARVPGASLHRIRGAAHGVHFTHPGDLADWIVSVIPA